MKWFKLIFPVYLLLLSCMPCAVVEDGMDNMATISTSNHSTRKNQAETCSPFCTCNCCGVRVATPQVFVVNAITFSVFKEKYSAFQSLSFQNAMSHSIWQPPKLS